MKVSLELTKSPYLGYASNKNMPNKTSQNISFGSNITNLNHMPNSNYASVSFKGYTQKSAISGIYELDHETFKNNVKNRKKFDPSDSSEIPESTPVKDEKYWQANKAAANKIAEHAREVVCKYFNKGCYRDDEKMLTPDEMCSALESRFARPTLAYVISENTKFDPIASKNEMDFFMGNRDTWTHNGVYNPPKSAEHFIDIMTVSLSDAIKNLPDIDRKDPEYAFKKPISDFFKNNGYEAIERAIRNKFLHEEAHESLERVFYKDEELNPIIGKESQDKFYEDLYNVRRIGYSSECRTGAPTGKVETRRFLDTGYVGFLWGIFQSTKVYDPSKKKFVTFRNFVGLENNFADFSGLNAMRKKENERANCKNRNYTPTKKPEWVEWSEEMMRPWPN